MAEYYFHIAIAADHQDAIEDIVIAYAYGRGYIAKDINKFIDICESLIKKENQAVALGYGAWLLGMTVEGGEPLAEAIKVHKNPSKGLDCLLMASRGKQLELEVIQGNQLLALYFAWFSIPVDQRVALPNLMKQYQLSSLASFVEQDEKKAIQFLDHAFFGANNLISQLAKDILQESFGQYFLDEELTPVDA